MAARPDPIKDTPPRQTAKRKNRRWAKPRRPARAWTDNAV